MPDLRSIINQLQNDPNFAAMSYSDQVEARSHIYAKFLKDDAKFQSLSPGAKKVAYENLIFAPPVFENKQTNQAALSVYQEYMSQDPKLQKRAANLGANVATLSKTVDSSIVATTLFKGHQQTEGGLAYQLGQKVGGMLVPEGERESAQNFNNLVKHFDSIEAKERKKYAEYWDYTLDKDKRGNRFVKFMGDVAPITGFILDTAVTQGFAKAAAAPLAKVVNAKVAGLAAKIPKSAFSRMLWTKGVPLAARTAGEALVGSTREVIKDLWIDKDYSLDFENVARNGIGHFGDYFVGDLLFHSALFSLKKLARPLKGAFKGWDSVKAAKNIEDTKDMIKMATSSTPISANVLATFPKNVQDTYKKLKVLGVLNNVEKVAPGSTDWWKLLGLSKGYTIDALDKGFSATSMLDEGAKSVKFKDANELQNFLFKESTKSTISKVLPGEKISIPVDSKIKVTGKINTTIKGLDTDDLANMTRAITPRNGILDKANLKTFGKVYFDKTGIDPKLLDGIKVSYDSNYFRKSIDVLTENADELKIPTRINTITQQKKFVENLFKQLDRLTPEGKVLSATGKLSDKFLDNYSKNVYKQNLYSPEWIKYAAQKEFGGIIEETSDGVLLRMAETGEVRKFKSINDIGDAIYRMSLTDDMVKKHLLNEEGLTLIKSDSTGRYLLKDGAKVLDDFENIDQLYTKYPQIAPKIPANLMPDVHFIDADSAKITINKGMATGTYQDTFRFMDKFNNYSKYNVNTMVPFKNKGKLFHNQIQKTVEVRIPDIEHTQVFTSIKDAKEFLEGGWKEFDNLKGIAVKKGYRLTQNKGTYLLYQMDQVNPIAARNLDEVYAALKAAPTPSYAKDLSGLSDEIFEGLVDEAGNPLKIPDDTFAGYDAFEGIKQMDRASLFDPIRHTYQPTDSVFEQYALRQGDIGKATREKFKGMMQANRAVESEVFQNHQVIDRILSPGGKMIPQKRLKKLGEILTSEVGPDKWDEVAESIGYKMIPEDKKILENVREYLGKDETHGLFAKFGIDGNLFLQDYFPRIRKYTLGHLEETAADGSKKIFDHIFGRDKLPKEIDFFAKHHRTNELLLYSTDTNLRSVLYKYSDLGHKSLLMGPVLEDSVSFLKKQGSKMSHELKYRFSTFLDEVMGVPVGKQKSLKKASLVFSTALSKLLGKSKTLTKMGIPEKVITNDVTQFFMNMSYGGTMAYRPWLPIRNQQQVWTTLAPRVGNDIVSDAIARVVTDKNGDIIKRLRSTGRIRSQAPIMGMDGKTQKFIGGGLKWYKNSDEYTRAVVDQVADILVKDSAERLAKGHINVNQFLEMSGLDRMNPFDRKDILGLLGQNKIQSAIDLYGHKLTIETMFPYTKGTNPTAFRGVVGKLFGQMGHYPVYFVENLKRGMRYATKAQKLKFASRYIANSMALFGAFSAVGIEAKNFLPGNPLRFTGGPYYQVMNDALAASGSGYQAEQARAELGRTLPKLMIPGSLEFLSIQKALASFEEGDFYRGFLNLTSSPLRD